MQHSPPDQFLGAPIWTVDGQALIYELAGGRAGIAIERAAPDGGGRQTLVRAARAPTLSPDGSQLAFIRSTNVESLMVQSLAGGSERQILAPDVFVGLSYPRFSPDGQQLAFLGIGGPAALRLPPAAEPLASLKLGPATAMAHGVPWDPWVVRLDGSGLRQVASLAEDDPTVAWSPDGTTLAVLGGGGLWLTPVDGSANPALIANGSYGLLDWRP